MPFVPFTGKLDAPAAPVIANGFVPFTGQLDGAPPPGIISRAASSIGEAASNVYGGVKDALTPGQSVMDNYTPPAANDTKGAPLSLGAGPISQDFATKTTNDLNNLPLPAVQKIAKGTGPTAAIAKDVLPVKEAHIAQTASGDLTPTTPDEFGDKVLNQVGSVKSEEKPLSFTDSVIDGAKIVGIPAVARGVIGGAETGVRAIAYAASALPLAADIVHSMINGPTDSATEWAKQNFINPATTAVDFWKITPEESDSVFKTLAYGLGNLGGQLPFMGLAGTAKSIAVTKVSDSVLQGITNQLKNGATVMSPMMFSSAINLAAENTARGMSPTDAVKSSFADILSTSAMGSVPMGATGPILKSAAVGAANMTALGAVGAQLQNAAIGNNPEFYQDPLDIRARTMDALNGLLFGVTIGRQKTPMQQAIQDFTDSIKNTPNKAPDYAYVDALNPNRAQYNVSRELPPVSSDDITQVAQQHLDALNLKANGLPDQNLTDQNKAAHAFLTANIDKPDVLAAAVGRRLESDPSAEASTVMNSADPIAAAKAIADGPLSPADEMRSLRPLDKMPAKATPIDAPVAPEKFLSPQELDLQDHQAKAAANGLTPEQATAMAPTPTLDHVTGFNRAEAKVPTVARALDYVNRTGNTAHFVDGDIANLGGLNTHFGNDHTQSNAAYRAMSDIFADEMNKAGSQGATLIRHGGDEISAVVVGGTDASINSAMENARARIADYAAKNGLADIPHPKHIGDSSRNGVGLYMGQSDIVPKDSLDDIFSRAARGIDSAKKGESYVGQIKSHDVGLVSSGGQPAAVRGGSAEAGRSAQPAHVEEPQGLGGKTEVAPETAVTKPADIASDIRSNVEALIKLKKNADQIKLVPQLAAALTKAKAVMKSGTGKASDFAAAAKQFKGKDDQIYAALKSIENALEPAQPAKPVPKQAAQSLIPRLRQLGGVNISHLKDITGESDVRKSGAVGVFSKNGKGLDDLATTLADEGFPIDTSDVDGGVQQLRDHINDALHGNEVLTHAAMDAKLSAGQEAEHKDGVNKQAKTLGIKTVGRKFNDIEDEVLKRLANNHATDGEALTDEEYNAADEAMMNYQDIFGEEAKDAIYNQVSEAYSKQSPKVFYAELTKRYEEATNEHETRSAGEAALAAARKPSESTQVRGAEDGTGTDATAFDLKGQDNAEIIEQEHAAAERARDEATHLKAVQAEKDRADLAARTKTRTDNPDNFQFGESSKDAVKPHGDLFAQPEAKPADQSASTIIAMDDIPKALKITLEKEVDGKTNKKLVDAKKALLSTSQRIKKLESLMECLG